MPNWQSLFEISLALSPDGSPNSANLGQSPFFGDIRQFLRLARTLQFRSHIDFRLSNGQSPDFTKKRDSIALITK